MAKKMGRPKIEIDWKFFDAACKLLATQEEICGHLNISVDTLSRRVKEKHKLTFAEYIKKSGSLAKVSLRRYQFNMAKTSPAMAIFLGKNYLGQADKIHQEITGKDGERLFKDPESEMKRRGIPIPPIGIEDAKDESEDTDS